MGHKPGYAKFLRWWEIVVLWPKNVLHAFFPLLFPVEIWWFDNCLPLPCALSLAAQVLSEHHHKQGFTPPLMPQNSPWGLQNVPLKWICVTNGPRPICCWENLNCYSGSTYVSLWVKLLTNANINLDLTVLLLFSLAEAAAMVILKVKDSRGRIRWYRF